MTKQQQNKRRNTHTHTHTHARTHARTHTHNARARARARAQQRREKGRKAGWPKERRPNLNSVVVVENWPPNFYSTYSSAYRPVLIVTPSAPVPTAPVPISTASGPNINSILSQFFTASCHKLHHPTPMSTVDCTKRHSTLPQIP